MACSDKEDATCTAGWRSRRKDRVVHTGKWLLPEWQGRPCSDNRLSLVSSTTRRFCSPRGSSDPFLIPCRLQPTSLHANCSPGGSREPHAMSSRWIRPEVCVLCGLISFTKAHSSCAKTQVWKFLGCFVKSHYCQ